MSDGGGIVTGAVPAAVLGGQLVDGLADHRQLVGTGVGGGVAGAKHAGEGLSAGIEEAEHGVEPEAALEVRAGSLLVGRVDLHQRGVRRRGSPPRGLWRWPTAWPWPWPEPGEGRRARRRRCHAGPATWWGRRRHLTEQSRLVSKRCQIRHALPTAGHHDRHLGQQPAPVMTGGAFAAPWNSSRIGRSEPASIGEISQKMQADLGDDLAVAFHHHDALCCLGSVHLGSALLFGSLLLSSSAVSLTRRAFSRTAHCRRRRSGEGSGLIATTGHLA